MVDAPSPPEPPRAPTRRLTIAKAHSVRSSGSVQHTLSAMLRTADKILFVRLQISLPPISAMTSTNFAALSTLIGLAFDLVGAFLLAAEAIGLDKIQAWKDKWIEDPIYIMTPSKTVDIDSRAKERHRPHIAALFVGLASGVGAGLGGLLARSITDFTGAKWMWIIGLIVGGLIGAYAIDGILALLRFASGVLTHIVAYAGKGSIGVLGFAFLAVGFLFQGIGTIPSLLSR